MKDLQARTRNTKNLTDHQTGKHKDWIKARRFIEVFQQQQQMQMHT